MRWAIALAERVAPLALGADTDTCLYRALARYGTLGAHGVAPTFVLGVPQGDRPGHAWVEVAGRAFREPGTPTFIRGLERAWPRAQTT